MECCSPLRRSLAPLQDAVGVDEEFHFDARQAGGCWRNLERKTGQRSQSFANSRSPWRTWMSNAGLIVDTGV